MKDMRGEQDFGRFEPELTAEEFTEIRRRLASDETRYTIEQLLARLRSNASPKLAEEDGHDSDHAHD